MILIFAFKVISTKPFTGKLVNRRPAYVCAAITASAKSKNLTIPIAIYKILENNSIKTALRIVCGTQRDAENLVTVDYRSGINHVLF